ncbi:MAG TPA: hypothetical protein VLK36_05065 [Gaiellaceae bacterium]|nr:hypothetical protein [Gaiellaceae bacterium]
MGAWYSIGVLVGLGTSFGVAAEGALRRPPFAAVLAAVAAVVVALVFWGYGEAVGGVVGAVCGSFGAAPLVAGTLRRGGTRGGTAALLVAAALIGAALAFIPIVGYLEAVVVPAVGVRLRRRAPDTHAGLRTLARD